MIFVKSSSTPSKENGEPPSGQPAQRLPRLQRKLDEYLNKPGTSMARLAQAASVSTRTIQDLKSGNIYPANQSQSQRARMGLAGSFTRLAPFLGLSVKEALDDYGVDIDAPGVRELVARAGTRSRPNQAVLDDTLQAIAARKDRKNLTTPEVNVSAMEWPPFFDSESPETSFAYRYMAMLFGGINSDWRMPIPNGYRSIGDATKNLLDESKDLDAIFGLYETAFRRSLGIAYVPIPGITVPLDVLVVDQIPGDFDWRTVLDRFDDREYKAAYAVTIKDEAGAHVLAGLCRYPSASIVQCQGCTEVSDYYDEIVSARNKYGKARTVFFCADQFTCLDILEFAHKRKEFDVTSLNQHLHDFASAPAFPVGIAIREQSQFLKTLLLELTKSEIFGLVLPRVARLYVDLFWEPASANLKFDSMAMRYFLGDERWAAFQAACRTAAEARIHEQNRRPTDEAHKFWYDIKLGGEEDNDGQEA